MSFSAAYYTKWLYRIQDRAFEQLRYREEQRRHEDYAAAHGWPFCKFPEDAPFYAAQRFVDDALEWLADVEAALSRMP